MSFRFSLTSGEVLETLPGLPGSYRGPILKGSEAMHILAPFGSIVIQEICAWFNKFCRISITWNKPEKLVCRHEYPASIFCHMQLNNSMYQVVKGAGGMHIKPNQFNVISGSTWDTLLIPEKAGEHHFLNLYWPPYLLRGLSIVNNDLDNHILNSFRTGLPHRVTHVPHTIDATMKQSVNHVMRVGYSSETQDDLFEQLMLPSFRLVVQEITNKKSIRQQISKDDLHILNKARQLIDENLTKRFTTPELSSKVGMNENKLKKNFPKLTGYAVDEYRKYQLFVDAGRKIMENTGVAFKTLSADAGYPSVTNFIRAFKNLVYCTPGELRDDSWDVSRIGVNFMHQVNTEHA